MVSPSASEISSPCTMYVSALEIEGRLFSMVLEYVRICYNLLESIRLVNVMTIYSQEICSYVCHE